MMASLAGKGRGGAGLGRRPAMLFDHLVEQVAQRAYGNFFKSSIHSSRRHLRPKYRPTTCLWLFGRSPERS